MGLLDIFKIGTLIERIAELESENQKLKNTIEQLNEELYYEKLNAGIVFNIKNVESIVAYAHPDLRGLLYISNENTVAEDFSKQDLYEPSTIYKFEPVITPEDTENVPRPDYWPTYLELESEQKYVYLKALENPYDPSINIGYIFLLYYGLERQLYEGDFDKAFNVIMKLREVHLNNSFQNYSANALLISAMMQQRMDKLEEFYFSLEARDTTEINCELYVFLKAFIGLPFTAADLILCKHIFGYTKKTYMDSRYNAFSIELSNVMRELFGTSEVDLSPFLDKIAPEMSNIYYPYANLSLKNVKCSLPNVCEVIEFKSLCMNALNTTHENIKKARIKK